MLFSIIWIITSIMLWVLYHKIFTVYYFSLGKGLAKEMLWCGIIGAVIAYLVMIMLVFAVGTIGIVISILIFVKTKKILHLLGGLGVTAISVILILMGMGMSFGEIFGIEKKKDIEDFNTQNYLNEEVEKNPEKEQDEIIINEDNNEIVIQDEGININDFKIEKINTRGTNATSTLESNSGIAYNSNFVLDENEETAWVEGVSGDGIGERIGINLYKKSLIKEIDLINGYSKNQDIYDKNNRVKKIALEFDDGTYSIHDLSDGNLNHQKIILDTGVVSSYVNIKILEVYKGYKYEDTAISEINISGINDIENLDEKTIELLKKK